MMLLVDGIHQDDDQYPDDRFGYLVGPYSCPVERVGQTGRLWAADNGACYARGFNAARFLMMVARIAAANKKNFLWLTVPDVVGDAAETYRLWQYWSPILRAQAIPLAFVAQNRLQPEYFPPWDTIDALFIGGTPSWQFGNDVGRLVAAAKGEGKWVHMGGASGLQRIRIARTMGCDSVDSSAFSRWRRKYTPGTMRTLMAELDGLPLWN